MNSSNSSKFHSRSSSSQYLHQFKLIRQSPRNSNPNRSPSSRRTLSLNGKVSTVQCRPPSDLQKAHRNKPCPVSNASSQFAALRGTGKTRGARHQKKAFRFASAAKTIQSTTSQITAVCSMKARTACSCRSPTRPS